jgi:hypothetical protein
MADSLHTLAAQYLDDGRVDDARRVLEQADKVLRDHAPGSSLLDVVRATTRTLDGSI